MPEKKIIATWVYKRGELLHQRVMDNMQAIAFVMGILLYIILLLPVIQWNTNWFTATKSLLLLLGLLAVSGVLLFTAKTLGNAVFALYRRFKQPSEEEIIITTEKIITEKKTWILEDEKRQLTTVEYDAANTQLIFRGREIAQSQQKKFIVRLPLPRYEGTAIKNVVQYFTQRVQPPTLLSE